MSVLDGDGKRMCWHLLRRASMTLEGVWEVKMKRALPLALSIIRRK